MTLSSLQPELEGANDWTDSPQCCETQCCETQCCETQCCETQSCETQSCETQSCSGLVLDYDLLVASSLRLGRCALGPGRICAGEGSVGGCSLRGGTTPGCCGPSLLGSVSNRSPPSPPPPPPPHPLCTSRRGARLHEGVVDAWRRRDSTHVRVISMYI